MVETVRFAIKATRELNLSGFKPGKEGVAGLGAELGHEVAASLFAETKESMYAKLESFFEKSGMGVMTLIQVDPVLIKLKDPDWSDDVRTTDAFKKSLLEAILREALGPMVSVQGPESGAKGGTEWVIRLKPGR